MSRKLVIKHLKKSDLGLFESYYRVHPQGGQKAIGLDKALLLNTLYPSLPEIAAGLPDAQVPVQLRIFGPGGAGLYSPMRKILEQDKNWRLNGELIYDPIDEPGRFAKLQPDDIALMEFVGSASPHDIRIVFLAANDPADKTLFQQFKAAYPGPLMAATSEQAVNSIIGIAAPDPLHPITTWLGDEDLEEVAQGDADATASLLTRRGGRGLTSEELKQAKLRAEETGRQGEVLLDYFFSKSAPAGAPSHKWVAKVNAISPYDFLLTLDGVVRHADAKSTQKEFGSCIFLSLSEIRHALTSGVPYDLYRLFRVTETSAVFRVCRDIAPKLAPVLATLKALPIGVKVDSLSFDPAFFGFDEHETSIEYQEEEAAA